MFERINLRSAAWVLAWMLGLVIAPGPARAETNWTARVETRLESSLAELARVRKQIADEQIPLSKTLAGAETAQVEARQTYEEIKRQLDRRNLDLGNLRKEIKTREDETSYLSSLLTEYIRNFETRLHIAELARYQGGVEAARLAPESGNLKPAEVFAAQVNLVATSLERLEGLTGGDRFEGQGAGEDGLVKKGAVALLGPVAYFASRDGETGGILEQRLGSLEPAILPYADPAFVAITRRFVETGEGLLPFDATLGSAHKIEETKESLAEHIGKGGPVMVPLLSVGGLAMLIAVVKWILFSLVRIPPPHQCEALLEAVRRGNQAAAKNAAAAMKGPVGDMLRVGVQQLDAPKDLVEEVMFEVMLDTKYRLQKALPIIAVTAACAPLLGLLGTVTGIIGTFKLITVFGSGDVKMLSAGISEALITTEFGLCVAIPSLVAHSFLSRKAKAVTDTMERMAIAFLTEIEKARTNGVLE